MGEIEPGMGGLQYGLFGVLRVRPVRPPSTRKIVDVEDSDRDNYCTTCGIYGIANHA